MKHNQRGALIVEIIVIIIVVSAIGFVGYKVLGSRDTAATKTSSTANENPTPSTVAKKAWKEGGFAVEGTYADASVIQIADDTWRMYYAIQPEVQGNKFEVYSSTSQDGKTWTKEEGTRKTMATFPEVIKTADDKYRMYFQQAGEIKSAISTDGLSFTDEAGSRVDKSNDLGLTFDNVAAPAVKRTDDGTYMMVYRGTINTRYAADTPNPTTQILLWATSSDGLAFTKKGMAVDSRTEALRGQLDGPMLVTWDDKKTHVFATTYSGVYEFVFDGTTFSKGELAYSLASDTPTPAPQGGNVRPPDVAPPGDPTIANIKGTWFMYYGGPRSKNGINYATYQ